MSERAIHYPRSIAMDLEMDRIGSDWIGLDQAYSNATVAG